MERALHFGACTDVLHHALQVLREGQILPLYYQFREEFVPIMRSCIAQKRLVLQLTTDDPAVCPEGLI
jgi:hypothetical protein